VLRSSNLRRNVRDAVPGVLLTVGFVITLALFLLILKAAFSALSFYKTVETDGRTLDALGSDLRGLNDDLSLSALLVIAIGDSASEARYRAAETRLHTLIARAGTVLDTARTGLELSRVRQAHARRVATEQVAAQSARRGDYFTAYHVLNSDDYLKQKREYVASIEAALNVLNDRMEHSAESLRSELKHVAVFTGGALLVSWLVVFSWLRNSRVRRRRAEAERERLIHELKIKNEELDQFAHAVSHDLKSPLITIGGFLKWVEHDALNGNRERLRQNLERISSAVMRMEALLNAVLKLSRSGHAVRPTDEFPAADVVTEAVELVRGRIAQRGVNVLISPDLPVVFGDRARLLEVMLNLVDNAVKFMGDQEEPSIEIGSRSSSDFHVLFVKDNGAGIDPCHHSHVLELFSKLSPANYGYGVGLALVKRIVEKHGGSVWVESEGTGKGTTFCFTLPKRPAHSQ
jgi:signal transduction histidine kinase